MERGRGRVRRYGGAFPIAFRCIAISSIKLTRYPFGNRFDCGAESECDLRGLWLLGLVRPGDRELSLLA